MANAGSLFVQLMLDSTRYAAGLSETTKKTNQTVRAIQRQLRGLVNFAVGAGGFYAIVRGFRAVTAAAAAQEEATLRLSQTLKNSYQFTYGNIRALESQASALQKVTRYGDEVTTAAMSQLMAIGKLNTEGVTKIIPAVQDFATAMRMDLVTAAELVAKSLGSQTNSLARYGIQLDMTKQGAERLAELQAALNTAFKGQASIEGYTTAITQLKNAIGDLNEEIGFMVVGRTGGIAAGWAKIVSDLSGGMQAARETQDWWQMNLPGEKPAGKVKTTEGTFVTFYTEEQRLRAESVASAYEAYQQKVNLIRKENADKIAAEQAANNQRIKDAEDTAKELAKIEEKHAREWESIIAASHQAAYEEVMGRSDVWDEMIKEREEAAKAELKFNQEVADSWSDWYEGKSQAGQKSWQIYIDDEAKLNAERYAHQREQALSFANYFTSILSNSAQQSGNFFDAMAANFKRMLEVMAADLAAKAAIFGIFNLISAGSLGTFRGFLGIPGFAGGGMVGARKPILVGERGPEIFMPHSSGKIIPNGDIDQSKMTVIFNGAPGNLGSRMDMVGWLKEAHRRGELKFLTERGVA